MTSARTTTESAHLCGVRSPAFFAIALHAFISADVT